MPRLAIVSGKVGGLQAMVPMMRHFMAGGWKVHVTLCDQHFQDRWAADTLPPGVVLSWAYEGDTRIHGLTRTSGLLWGRWSRHRPDVVIVYGDRMDALVGATVAHEMLIPVAHLQAGDLSGNIDNANRYAITALAKWAFCSEHDAGYRVLAFKTSIHEGNRVHVVGDHHIDAVAEVLLPPTRQSKHWLLHLHPDTLACPDVNYRAARDTVTALRTQGDEIIAIEPCSDIMREPILEAYSDLGLRPRAYVPLHEYIPLMWEAHALVGNSSATIIDAPFLGVPTIQIGHRQRHRGVEGCTNRVEIAEAMAALPHRTERSTRFGDGTAGLKTFQVLNEAFHG